MNFRIITSDRPEIVKTGAAIGPTVFGSLKMARAALSDAIDARVALLRDGKREALKVREADLASEPSADEQRAA